LTAAFTLSTPTIPSTATQLCFNVEGGASAAVTGATLGTNNSTTAGPFAVGAGWGWVCVTFASISVTTPGAITTLAFTVPGNASIQIADLTAE
jgi:hypothetical protein